MPVLGGLSFREVDLRPRKAQREPSRTHRRDNRMAPFPRSKETLALAALPEIGAADSAFCIRVLRVIRGRIEAHQQRRWNTRSDRLAETGHNHGLPGWARLQAERYRRNAQRSDLNRLARIRRERPPAPSQPHVRSTPRRGADHAAFVRSPSCAFCASLRLASHLPALVSPNAVSLPRGLRPPSRRVSSLKSTDAASPP